SLNEALALFHECMQSLERMVGRDHPSLGAHFLGYGQSLGERDRAVEAVPLLVEGLRIYRTSKGDDWNPAPVVEMLDRYVRRIVARGDGKPADYTTALAGVESLSGDKPATSAVRHLHGMVLYRLGRIDEALAELNAPSEGGEPKRDSVLQRLAFAALAQQKLGNADAARQSLSQLREQLAGNDEKPGKDAAALISEAEAAVAGAQEEAGMP
ncbi:MAG: tetratricopeptide repeat protein, partial [Planctomycetia bacterium]|nr:tetratricopeptide repeat protein [Planctomycetia bacterium]